MRLRTTVATRTEPARRTVLRTSALRHGHANARRPRAGTEPSTNHRAANTVTRRPPVCRPRPGKPIANPELLHTTAVEIASRTPGRVRMARRPVDVPRPLVARFGSARFGPRARAGEAGAPGGSPAKGSPDAAGRWAARDSSAQGGPPARGGENSGGRGDLHPLNRGMVHPGGWYTLGSRLSALGSRLSALGSRLSALGSRLSALGSRLSALGSRLSALGSRLSALGSRLSALGSRLSALLIASSEFAPDAPSCGVRTAAGDCAVAGARPSTSCRSIRIDVRPCGVSEGPIFDPHGHIINRNIRKSPSHRGASGPATAGRWFRSAARSLARSCPGSVTMRVGRVRGRPGPASAGAAASRRRRRPPRRGGEKGKALQLRGFVPSHAMADTDRRGTGGPGASESQFTSRRAFSPPQLHESPWQAKTSPRRHESHRVSADRGRRPPNASNG